MANEKPTTAREAMLERILDPGLRAAVRLVFTHFDEQGVALGVADLFCLGPDRAYDLLAASAAYFAIARSDRRSSAFSKVFVVVGSRANTEDISARTKEVLRAFAPEDGRERLDRLFQGRIEIHRLESLDAAELAATVRRAPTGSGCIVASAADYRNEAVPGLNYEEEWVHHLVRTTSALEEVASERSIYVQVLGGRHRPRFEQNTQALVSIQGAVVMDHRSEGMVSPEELLEGWLVQAKADLAGALASVEHSSLGDDDKVVVTALCRHAAGDPQACDVLRPVLERVLANANPENVTVLARVAAGDIPFAALLLERAASTRRELTGHSALVELAFTVLEGRLRRLDRPLTESSAEFSDIVRALAFLTCYLGEHPRDGRSRVRLTNALSTEASGMNGVVLLAWAVLRSHASIELAALPNTVPREAASLEEFAAFHKECLERRSSAGVTEVSLTPEPLSTPVAATAVDALLQRGTFLVEHMAWRFVANEEDSRALLLVVKTCIDLAAAAGDRFDGLELLRLAGSGIADSGGSQMARDLAEHALLSCQVGANATKRWFAWLTFSDVYHRLHNPLEALVAWLSAHSQPGIVASPRQVFPSIALGARLLRDIGFHDAAREFAEEARVLLESANIWEQNRHQVEGLEASIEFRRLISVGGVEKEWRTLAGSLSGIVERGLEHVENVGVPATLLAQVLRIMEMQQWPETPRDAKALKDAMGVVGEPVASRLRAYRAESPDMEAIRRTGWGSPVPRYARDLGEDLHKAAILAKRVLSDASRRGEVAAALASIELLLDHSISLPEGPYAEGAVAVTVNEALSSPERLVDAIKHVSARGVEVHALGLTEDGRLARVSAWGGNSVEATTETQDTFSYEAVGWWDSAVRPGFPTASDGEVSLNSMEQKMRRVGIGRNGRPSGHVFIRGPLVADVPANLMLAEGVLLGAVAPVTSAPSLSWLSTELARVGKAPTARRAWLLPAKGIGPLGILYDGLLDSLPRHGFDVVTTGRPPDLARAGIAVVAGHGSLWKEQKFFRVVTGEDETAVTPFEIADAVAGTSIVVLLVCSGGRLDRDLFSSRGIGLPHLLLGRGCSSIVASPWPVDASKAGRWLESFLEGIAVGLTVSESTFHANGELQRNSNRAPDFLAMHVYGNPFVTANARA